MGQQHSFPVLKETETRVILNDLCKEFPYKIPKKNNIQLINAGLTKIQKLPLALDHLVDLNLAGNEYSVIPQQILAAIQSYPLLETLTLSFNLLNNLPDEISNKESLRRLELLSNKLTSINLSALTKLDSADISQNRLTEFPKLPESLTQLVLDFNLIQEINLEPSSLIKFTAIQNKLNKFTFKQPMSELWRIELAMNNLTEVPDFAVQTPKLRYIDLSNNLLKTFPSFPKTITDININMNQISELPADISSLIQLINFNIFDNKLKRVPQLPLSLQVFNAYNNEIEFKLSVIDGLDYCLNDCVCNCLS